MLLSQTARKSAFEKVRQFFGGVPSYAQAAALPWREGPAGIEVLLITSRDTGRWVLPKGWPEGEEYLWEAAEREAAEEAGVRGEMSSRPVGCYLYGKVLPSGLVRRCQVHVYPLKVGQVVKKWPEKNVRARKWVEPREAAAMVKEQDLAELLAAFQP